MLGLSVQDKTVVELCDATRRLWLSRREIPEHLFGQLNDALEDAGQCELAEALRGKAYCVDCLTPQCFHRGPGRFVESYMHEVRLFTITRVIVGCVECTQNGRKKDQVCSHCAGFGYLPLWRAQSYACRVCFGLGKLRHGSQVNCPHCHGLCIFTMPPENWIAAAFHWQPCETRRRFKV